MPTVREVLSWLDEQSSDRPVHLGPIVASREDYSQPAVTLKFGATASESIRAIRESLEQPHEGWKGGLYKYSLSSPVRFNPRFGVCGAELSDHVLEAICAIGDEWQASLDARGGR